jgi:hypothetical protein
MSRTFCSCFFVEVGCLPASEKSDPWSPGGASQIMTPHKKTKRKTTKSKEKSRLFNNLNSLRYLPKAPSKGSDDRTISGSTCSICGESSIDWIRKNLFAPDLQLQKKIGELILGGEVNWTVGIRGSYVNVLPIALDYGQKTIMAPKYRKNKGYFYQAEKRGALNQQDKL